MARVGELTYEEKKKASKVIFGNLLSGFKSGTFKHFYAGGHGQICHWICSYSSYCDNYGKGPGNQWDV